jgi:PAS domain S-box-containing protein
MVLMTERKDYSEKHPEIPLDERVAGVQKDLLRLRKSLESQPVSSGEVQASDQFNQSMEEILNRLEEVTDLMGDGVFQLNHQGEVIACSACGEELFGWSERDVFGRKISEIMMSESQKGVFQSCFETLAKEKDGQVSKAELSLTLCDRDTRQFPAELTLWQYPKGQTTEFMLFVRDISDKKRVERLKNEFISTVSHELRTPMTIIREGVSQIVDGLLGDITEEQRGFLDVALHGIDRLSGIVNDLLDIAKLEARRVEFQRSKVDFVGIAKEVIARFENRVTTTGIELRLKTAQTQSITYADRQHVADVFYRLISNGFNFTKRGFIEVSVREAGDVIQCSVSDSGLGIDPKDVSNIFNKFEHFGPDKPSHEADLGLGLSIVKEIVEQHDGEVAVEGELNRGTKFTFYFPRVSPRDIFKKYVEACRTRSQSSGLPGCVIAFRVRDYAALHKRLGEERVGWLFARFEEHVQKGLRRKGDHVISDEPFVFVVLRDTTEQDAKGISTRLGQIIEAQLVDEYRTELKGSSESLEIRMLSAGEETSSAEVLLKKLSS